MWLNKTIIKLIKGYQKYIPKKYYHCRNVPTCSEFAIAEYERKNILTATIYTWIRILKCQPFFKSNYDSTFIK